MDQFAKLIKALKLSPDEVLDYLKIKKWISDAVFRVSEVFLFALYILYYNVFKETEEVKKCVSG